MITTLTPSPSLDLDYEIPELHPGELHRATYFSQRAGGKGVNVSRVLTRMGVQNCAIVPLEKSMSETFVKSAERDGIKLTIVDVEGALRFNATVLHEGKTTKINAAAKPWSSKESKRVADEFLSSAKRSEFAVIGGALPPSTPTDWILNLIREAKSRTRVVVDSSGETLGSALKAGPYLVKPNKEEAEEILGSEIRDVLDAADAAREIISLGTESVVLSLGSMGSIYASHDLVLFAKPAQLKIQNTVGAGDALLAGFLGDFNSGRQTALARGTAWAEAIITNQNMHLDISVHESAISRIISEGRIVSLPTGKGTRV